MQYRGVLRIGDFELFRTGKFNSSRVKEVYEQEVYFPDEIVFPFAAAREEAIKKALKAEAIPPRLPDETEDAKRKRHEVMVEASKA